MGALAKLGVQLSLFQIKKRGFLGYLKYLKPLKAIIKQYMPDIIHAHYGFSGLLANLQWSVPVVTTFHGSDINNPKALRYSKWAHKLSIVSIFVEKNMVQKVGKKAKCHIIPCGVDTSLFYSVSKNEALDRLHLKTEYPIILFSSAFNNPVKNYRLARKSCKQVEDQIGKKINLVEFKDFSREEVNLLMRVSDCVLLTSFSEGSPQIIKEAMACNCPIVSTDVGDIKWILGNTDGCFVTSFDIKDVARNIIKALEFGKRTNGFNRIFELELDSENVAKKILRIYLEVVNTKI